MATLKMGSTTVLTDTTLANAVQDNVTRLGTVTAGTLSHGTLLQGYVDSSNTGVTFPSGHIIQFFKAGTVGVLLLNPGDSMLHGQVIWVRVQLLVQHSLSMSILSATTTPVLSG